MPDTAPAAAPDQAALETARQLLADVVAATPKNMYSDDGKPDKVPAARTLFDAPPAVRRAAAIELQGMIGNGAKEPKSLLSLVRQLGTGLPNNRDYFLTQVLAGLLRAKLPFSPADLDLLLAGSLSDTYKSFWFHVPPSGYIRAAEQVRAEHNGLPDSTRNLLRRFRERVSDHDATHRKYLQQIDALLGITLHVPVLAGEAWSDHARAFLDSLSDDDHRAWVALLSHCATASAGTPSGKWLDSARLHVQAVGPAAVQSALRDWLPLVAKPRPTPLTGGYGRDPLYHICDPNVDVLKGLAWSATLAPSADVARALADLCETSLKRLPGIGPRLPKLANAAAYSLGQLCDDPASADTALGQLARLRTRVTYKTTLAQIDKALDAVAKRRNLSRDDLDELGIPTFGFAADGTRTETLGDSTVTLRIEGDVVVTTWTNEKGKLVKSPPAAVKRDHADVLKELKAAVKDTEQMLAAQRERLDRLFVTMKSWTYADFRQRYLTHPLVGPLARRLIWTLDGTSVLFSGDSPLDVVGKTVAANDASPITLWHPVGRTIDEITAWRRRLEDLAITQPFKQAHREIYILTDAELNTRTYSNRFVAHVIRQHQFHALCAHRGWRNKLRLLVDDTYPPASRDLPAFNLRAEFWVEGAGDDYGVDTNDTGAFLRLTTDQVRFYPLGAPTNAAHASGGGYGAGWQRDPATPLPLVDVPALAFSEIMRDVDLFVGVASVGNDPTWADGGPAGRYREYWQSYSFGELSASAQTRRDVLTRLLPRLKIADRCTLTDRFLRVRGELRTYKVHLGSGNILMEPNDQYLCIVPDRSSRSADTTLFLPFEGDTVLAIILSKAFMLADDTRINDSSIVRQIQR